MHLIEEGSRLFEEQQAKEKAKTVYNSHPLHFKNALKLQLTPDLQVPFEARKSHQLHLKVAKQVNRATG